MKKHKSINNIVSEYVDFFLSYMRVQVILIFLYFYFIHQHFISFSRNATNDVETFSYQRKNP